MDSNDAATAHWVGGCLLPREEQQQIFAAAAARTRDEDEATAAPAVEPAPGGMRWAARLNGGLGAVLVLWAGAMIVVTAWWGESSTIEALMFGVPMMGCGGTAVVMARRFRAQIDGRESFHRAPAVVAAAVSFFACLPGLLGVGVMTTGVVLYGAASLPIAFALSVPDQLSLYLFLYCTVFLPLAVLNSLVAVRLGRLGGSDHPSG